MHSKVLRAKCNVDAVVCAMSAQWKDDPLAYHDSGLQNVTVASFEQGLSARLPYLVDAGAVGTATDFGPTPLRLTGAAQVLDEVSASALI